MPDAHEATRRHVLYVAEVVDDLGARLERALASREAELLTVSDVYGALARLVGTRCASIDAVVVCLDGIEPAEAEFFSQVAQLPSSPPVMIYGRTDRAELRAEAIRRGATEIHDVADVLPRLGAHPEPSAPAADGPPSEPADIPETIPEDDRDDRPAPAAPASGPANEDAPETPEPEPRKAKADTPPPVPWAPSPTRPQRRAPVQSPVRSEDDERPLLTEEELRALLGSEAADGRPSRPNESERAP